MNPRTPEQERGRASQARVLKLRWWVAENIRRACAHPENPGEAPITEEFDVAMALKEREHNVRRWLHEGIAPHPQKLEKIAAWVMHRLLEAPPGDALPADLAALRKKRRR